MTEPDFTILGQRVTDAIPATRIETFPTPDGVRYVTFTTKEVTAFCPVTKQPDFYEVRIMYSPRYQCIESKSLKLYLMSFRDRGVFAERLAADIARSLSVAIEAKVVVHVTQQVRGGLVLEAEAEAEHDEGANE